MVHWQESPAQANFVDFEEFKKYGQIPRRGHNEDFVHPKTGQRNKNMFHLRSYFDATMTLFIFVSHRWLRPGGADGHPDDEGGSKYKLIVEAVEKLLLSKPMLAKDCKVALWIDYACVDQDLENPAKELDELHEIIAQCDVLLTPVHDPNHAQWDSRPTVSGWYVDYKAEGFQEYWKRAWCALEAMSASCMPVLGGKERALLFGEGAVGAAIRSDRRPHIVYGTKQSVNGGTPIFFPPLLHSNLVKYDPAKMQLTSEKDRGTIERIAGGLREHIKALEVGYVGERDTSGRRRHGRGKMTFESGDVYEGEYKDDKQSGRGTYKHASGNVYEGEWKDGDMNGRGKKTYTDGKVEDGRWENDEFMG